MKAAVIGHPIAHSKSPRIHQYWMEQYRINGSYEAINIAPENLKDGIKQLIENNYSGFNVTVPHKKNVIAFCDTVDETAQAIGAVNTIIIRDGKLIGKNTDAFGFIQNIKQSADFDFKNKTAFVLGAGGAARAVIYGLLNECVEKIYIANRTREKASALIPMAADKIEIIDWVERSNILKNIDFLVNATSLGMAGKPPLDIDLDGLPAHAVVSDIVYAPLMTDLLVQAKTRGNKTVTGIGMLLHQARPAFESWTGIMPDVTSDLERELLS